MRVTQAVLPHMRARSGGRIVNVASYVGRVYIPFVSTYVATKHAVEGWSDCLRAEVAPFGNIKVVIIEPGAIRTPLLVTAQEKAMGMDTDTSPYAKYYQAFCRRTSPLVELASPPPVIAETIVKAVESPQPQRRYVAGFSAKPRFCFYANGWATGSWIGCTRNPSSLRNVVAKPM